MSAHTLLYKKLFQHPLVRERLSSEAGANIDHNCVGWGYKASGIAAKKNAARNGYDLYLFEDAPVRSMMPSYTGAVFGVTIDSKGMMFDASGESALLERLQQERVKIDEATPRLMQRYREHGISKYNTCVSQDVSRYQPGVLLVDQTLGDAAHKASGLTESSFDILFKEALEENPDKAIYIKTHPDHLHKNKSSCFTKEQLRHPKVTILPADISPSDCFRFCKKIYVGSSLLGMEALIHECEVITYGWNFYAGWGLTIDRGEQLNIKRERKHSVLEIFQAMYIDYSHYYHPDTMKPCNLNEIIDYIILQREHWSKYSGIWNIDSLSPFQTSNVKKYFHAPTIEFGSKSFDKYLIWGAKDISKNAECNIIRAEDGFIRSNGLGAEFNFPLSWVFDDVGIYFDARSPSKLENILNDHDFRLEELAETEKLISFLREHKLTKYNLGLEDATLPEGSHGKKVILVPGQVDSDASIKYGSPKLSNNRELLAEVRRQHPDAYICYKPHPDLLKGARKDAPLWDGIEDDVDYLIMEGDIISWIQAVDEVHTLTSTVGFEALIHKKPVHTYGLPFYAGWGLTHDWLKCERRTTTRTLLELACATLILYPTYLNPITKEFTTAINAAKILANPEFKYDSRSGLLKAVGKIKSLYYNLMRRF